MSDLALFVESELDVILERFVQRMRSRDPADLSRKRLTDHLPMLLRALALELRGNARGEQEREAAEQHGAQRLEDGYDVELVVEEYGVLHDCVLEALEARAFRPDPRELRMLSGGIFEASRRSVARYLAHQRAAHEAERLRLLGIFENAPSFVAILRGPEHRFELANAAYMRLVGHRASLGKSVAEALPEVVEQGYVAMLDSVYRTGSMVEGKGARVNLQKVPDGPLEEAYLDFVYVPIFVEGVVTGILVQGHDITHIKLEQQRREHTERALRASEERYRTLFDNVDEGFCTIEMLPDASGRFTDWVYTQANKAFETQSGISEPVGKRIRDLVPDHDQFWFDLFTEVLATGVPARAEFHAEAMGRWFDVFAVRLGGPGSRELAVLFRDTSKAKRAQAERETLLALETYARERAEEAGRLKDDFLATLSHELRTPLNSIVGWVSLLQGGKLTPDKRERALATIARNANAQAQLIEDLLDMSRILAGKLRLERTPVDLRDVAELALESAKPSADAKPVQLSASLDGQAIVLADAQRLQQVIWNLLSNAVKFTPVGGDVHLSVEVDGATASVRVRDTGRGISPDFLPHVFERFRQANSSSTRGHQGLGLGLAISHQLVALQGGSIHAESAGEGQGACFTVRLPLASARDSVLPPPPSGAPDVDVRGMQVLIVEDDPDSREMLRAALETSGVLVEAAASVAECIQLLSVHTPHVVVTDLGMPEQDGYALLDLLRALPPGGRNGKLPVIALTAFAKDQDRSRALAAGFDAYLTKPVDVRELFTALLQVRR